MISHLHRRSISLPRSAAPVGRSLLSDRPGHPPLARLRDLLERRPVEVGMAVGMCAGALVAIVLRELGAFAWWLENVVLP